MDMKLQSPKITSNFIRNVAKKNNIDIAQYDMDQLMMGYVTEFEHDSDNQAIDMIHYIVDPLKITIAHLNEFPDYYDRLKDIEEVIRNEVRSIMWENCKM